MTGYLVMGRTLMVADLKELLVLRIGVMRYGSTFDLFDIATLGTGGAVVQPLRRKLAEIMIRTDRWDNALGKKILGDDVYNDLLNRAPSMTKDEYIQFEEDLITAADELDRLELEMEMSEIVHLLVTLLMSL